MSISNRNFNISYRHPLHVKQYKPTERGCICSLRDSRRGHGTEDTFFARSMSGPVAAGATLAMSVLIERTSRGVFRRDLGSHPENEVFWGGEKIPPYHSLLVARCFLVCGFSLIRECCGSECHMKDRKCILYRSIWLVPCLGHMGTGASDVTLFPCVGFGSGCPRSCASW